MSFLRDISQGIRPARESGAIEQGERVAQTQDTIDPKQLTSNDQFEAEIQKLMESQNGNANPEGNPEGGNQPPEETGNTEKPGEGEPAPDEPTDIPEDVSVTPEDEGKAQQNIDQETANAEGRSAPDPEHAAEQPTEAENVTKALEALMVTREQLGVLSQIYETGTVRPQHVQIARESMNLRVKRLPIIPFSVAREDAGSVFKNIGDFIMRIIRGIRDFLSNTFKWIADLARGWAARMGVYSRDEQGVKDRIAALKVTHAVVPPNDPEETAEVPTLANWYGNDIQGVMKAVSDLNDVQTTVLQTVAVESFAQTILNSVLRIVRTLDAPGVLKDNIQQALHDTVPVNEAVVFGRQGASTGFGNSPFFRDSLSSRSDTNNIPNTRVLVLSNLIGGNVLTWTLQDDTSKNLTEYASSLRGLDVALRRAQFSRSAQATTKIKLLRDVAEIEQVFAFREKIEKQATTLLDLSKRTAIFGEKLSLACQRALNVTLKYAQDPNKNDFTPDILADLGVIFGSAPEAYNRMASASLARVAGILSGVCDGLNVLAKASMASIDKKMGQGQDPVAEKPSGTKKPTGTK